MSDHDFEKQVQQKMEQLRLRPSDAVWTKVDKRIRMERRRRRVVLWLPLLLLTVAAGGYFFFETNSGNKFTASELKSTQTNTDTNASVNTSSATNEKAPDANARTSDQTAQTDIVPSASSEKNAASKPFVQPLSLASNKQVQPKNDLTAFKRSSGSGNKKKKGTETLVAPGISNANASASVSGAVKPGKKPSIKAPVAQSENQIAGNDNAGKNPVTDHQIDSAVAMQDPASGMVTKPFRQELTDATDSASAQPQSLPLVSLKPASVAKKQAAKQDAVTKLPEPRKRKPSTWSFGIVAEGGASHISKGNPFSIFDKKNSEPEDIAQSSPATSNMSFNGGPAGFTQPPPSKPADLKMGLSWSAGGFAQKKISKRFSISAGVQYSYFSMETEVGRFMEKSLSVSNASYDQTITGYYQGRTSSFTPNYPATAAPAFPMHEYTNKYHFIEVPVKIHWQVTNEDQLPIIVDGGLSIAQLLSTNALHYDGNNDVYYKDFSYFNKTQAGITAGVNLGLFTESSHPVWIGPTIKYQLSNLLKSDLSGGQHLWSFGVGAKVFLKK